MFGHLFAGWDMSWQNWEVSIALAFTEKLETIEFKLQTDCYARPMSIRIISSRERSFIATKKLIMLLAENFKPMTRIKTCPEQTQAESTT